MTVSATEVVGVIVGRRAEREAMASFLRDSAQSPAAIVLEGEPGIGKTTLWHEAVTKAVEDGYTVLSSQPAELDAQMPLSTLGDLLDSVDVEVLEGLPEPQRRAIRVSLFREDGEAVEWRALSVAVVNTLRILADERPVLLAIDDVQWVDPSSERILAFALRRWTTQPLRVLLARRSGADGAPTQEIEVALARFGRWTLPPPRDAPNVKITLRCSGPPRGCVEASIRHLVEVDELIVAERERQLGRERDPPE